MKTFNLGHPTGQKKKPPRREAWGFRKSANRQKKKSPHFWGPAKKEVVGSKAYLESSEYAGFYSEVETSDVLPGISDTAVDGNWKIQLVSDSSHCYAFIAAKVDR